MKSFFQKHPEVLYIFKEMKEDKFLQTWKPLSTPSTVHTPLPLVATEFLGKWAGILHKAVEKLLVTSNHVFSRTRKLRSRESQWLWSTSKGRIKNNDRTWTPLKMWVTTVKSHYLLQNWPMVSKWLFPNWQWRKCGLLVYQIKFQLYFFLFMWI